MWVQKTVLLFAALTIFSGCSDRKQQTAYDSKPPLDGDQKARADFLNQPVVKDFKDSGVTVDCDFRACAQVSSSTLANLKRFKSEFLVRATRIGTIGFVTDKKPYYDFRLRKVYLPSLFEARDFQAFFDVLRSNEQLEKDLGFQIEFPNSWYIESSIGPSREILIQNMETLIGSASYIQRLVINAKYDVYYPSSRTLGIKTDNLKASFEEIWKFDQVLFTAKDKLGDSSFRFEYGDAKSLAALLVMIDHADVLKPLLDDLGAQDFEIRDLEPYGYEPGYFDEGTGLSNRFDVEYFKGVFTDLIRERALAKRTGISIFGLSLIVLLEGRAECFDQFDQIESLVISKRPYIDYIAFMEASKDNSSDYYDHGLYLGCGESVEQWRAVIDQIH